MSRALESHGLADVAAVVRLLEARASDRVSGDGACLDALTLARLCDGVQSTGDRDGAIAHLAGCGHCRHELASLIVLMGDVLVASELRSLTTVRRGAPRRHGWMAVGALAAAALVLIVAWPGGPGGDVREHRGPTITASAAPLLLVPIGDVEQASELRWSAVAGSDQYRVTLYDASARVRFEAALTDTVVAVPDSVGIVPGASYLWKVEARTGLGRWASSELLEFRVRGPGRDSAMSPPRARDSLRVRAQSLSDAALVADIRSGTHEVRDAIASSFARAVHGPNTASDAELQVARRVAAAYGVAWHDDFLSREVARFAGWPRDHRAGKVWGDSVRRAALDVYASEGTARAIALWRRAAARAIAIGDTAGLASSLGNIGMVLADDGAPDSATAYLRRARDLASAVQDRRTLANTLSGLAAVRERGADIAGARDSYAQAIVIREKIGDTRGLASDYNSLAGLARTAGDYDAARGHLEAALTINRREGRPEVAATNLVNLAALAALTGEFARAEAEYHEANATWRARGAWASLADGLRGLGDLEVRRGDYPAARRALGEARSLYERTGAPLKALAMRRMTAAVRAAEGNLQQALDELGDVQRVADSVRAPVDIRAGISLSRGDVAVRLNALGEADRHYSSAESWYRRAGDRHGEAEARQGRGLVFLDRDNLVRAEELLSSAHSQQQALQDVRAAAITMTLLGTTALRRGDTAIARVRFAHAAADLTRHGDPVAAAAVLGEQAALELGAKYPAVAESLFRAGLAMVGARSAPDVSWRLHAGLGLMRREQGMLGDAARELRAGVADIERAGRTLSLAERRSGFLSDKWDVYVQLALVERARGDASAAFDVSERIRASEMLEQLAGGRVPARRDVSPALVAREQDLRRRISELTRGIETGALERQLIRGPDVSHAGPVSREALVRAQTDYGELLLELREKASGHAALVSRTTATWRDVAHRLAPDEAMIEYLVSDERSLAFVVTRDTLVQVTLGAARHDLVKRIDFVRGTLQPRGAARLDSLWRGPLRQLYADLIAPVAATRALDGKTRLVIVPHAELHYLPFAALIDGDGHGRFLVERYRVTVAPSASVWLALAERKPASAARGWLAFAPRPDALPASSEEVAVISKLRGSDARVVIGRAATESAFRAEAPGRRVIHLATFGVLNKQNPLFSFVEFAPGAGDDGRLEAHEVFGLRLSADLVVLSACQTGLASGAQADVPAGDDWIGLARAFLSAGAGHVIASLWPVQDRATAALMRAFYSEYKPGADPANALAAAQRELIRSPAMSSPYYWAGFELVGGR